LVWASCASRTQTVRCSSASRVAAVRAAREASIRLAAAAMTGSGGMRRARSSMVARWDWTSSSWAR